MGRDQPLGRLMTYVLRHDDWTVTEGKLKSDHHRRNGLRSFSQQPKLVDNVRRIAIRIRRTETDALRTGPHHPQPYTDRNMGRPGLRNMSFQGCA